MAWMDSRREIGSRVQYKSGYITVKVKANDGKEIIVSEHRRIYELTKGALGPGDRVIHEDGDRANNRPENLHRQHYNQTKYVPLKASRVLRPWHEAWGEGRKPDPGTKVSLVLPAFKPKRILVAA